MMCDVWYEYRELSIGFILWLIFLFGICFFFSGWLLFRSMCLCAFFFLIAWIEYTWQRCDSQFMYIVCTCICIATATSFILFLLRIQIRQTTKTCNDNKIARSFGVKDECEKWIEPLQSERHRNVRTHNLFPILTHTISLSFRCLLWRNTLFVYT